MNPKMRSLVKVVCLLGVFTLFTQLEPPLMPAAALGSAQSIGHAVSGQVAPLPPEIW